MCHDVSKFETSQRCNTLHVHFYIFSLYISNLKIVTSSETRKYFSSTNHLISYLTEYLTSMRSHHGEPLFVSLVIGRATQPCSSTTIYCLKMTPLGATLDYTTPVQNSLPLKPFWKTHRPQKLKFFKAENIKIGKEQVKKVLSIIW